MDADTPTLRPYPWQSLQWQQLLHRQQMGRLPHALLLAGPSGMGKRHFARALAHRLLCAQPNEAGACGTCRACLLLQAGNHPDFLWTMPEEGKRGIGIAQIRALIDFQALTSQYRQQRVLVLEPADRLERAAANALLKTLEEPAGDTVLLLISDHPASLLATIRSRCQNIPFRPIPPHEQSEAATLTWLRTQLQADGAKTDDVTSLLQASGGVPLAALRMATQNELQQRAEMLKQLLALQKQQASAVKLAQQWEGDGSTAVLQRLYYLFADMIRLRMVPGISQLASPPLRGNLQALAEKVDLQLLDALLQRIQERSALLRGQLKPQVILEEILLAWQQQRV